MSKRLLVTLTVLTLLLITATPAAAITYGEPDGGDHPYVGFAAFYDQYGTALRSCSGSLLSSTIFLTAGHCTTGAALAVVTFDSQVTPSPANIVTGLPFTHPDYKAYDKLSDTSDVGIVVLAQAVELAVYGQLPEAGLLDALATERGHSERIFTVVGYGAQSIKPRVQYDPVRYQATATLINLRSALAGGYNVHLSNNSGQGQGTGGTCFGDSGGPILYDDTNIIVGVTSFGLNDNCKGSEFAYRTDIAKSQEFIRSFFP